MGVPERTTASPLRALAAASAVALAVLFAAGCGESREKVSASGAGSFFGVAAEDARMNEAIAQAKAHLDTFERELATATPGRVFTVKKGFATPDGTEHLWIIVGRAANGGFEGVVDNEPRAVAGVAYGDRHFVARDDVTDWMITDAEGRRWGCYTTRVLLPWMPEEQRLRIESKLQPLPK